MPVHDTTGRERTVAMNDPPAGQFYPLGEDRETDGPGRQVAVMVAGDQAGKFDPK
jgi:hypothetical protein